MYDYFVFQSVFFMIFSFSSPPLFSSLFSCLVSPLTCLFFFFSFSSFLFSSLVSFSSFLFLFLFLSFVFSFQSLVFFLRVLVVCVVVCVCVCVSVCVVWCGVCLVVWHAEKPVCRLKNACVCRFKTSPCMPATRAHASQHVRVVPAYTETF